MTQDNPQPPDKKKPGPKRRKLYTSRLEELCTSKELVEIIAHGREITGHITEVGKDFVGISFSVEKEITKQVPKEGGGTAPEKQIVVMELETLLRYTDIESISRIKKQVAK